jgi:hypothetical protein
MLHDLASPSLPRPGMLMSESDRYNYQEVIFELHMLEASSRQGSHSSWELMQVCQLIQSH